jgi:hypothetical protein
MTLTPREHAEASVVTLGVADYGTICRRAGLDPEAPQGGYGLLFCEDDDGRHVTVATTDLDYHRMLVAAQGPLIAGLDIPRDVYSQQSDGWPDDWGAGS